MFWETLGGMLNVHHLELFYYVARHRGITEAVRRMPYGIQQPAVSTQLARLEQALGVKLFNRRPFGLTPAGAEVFAFIEPFFGGVERLPERVKEGEGAHLRLAASSGVVRDHFPALLAELRGLAPRLRLTLREAGQAEAEALLVRGELDMAVTVLESRPESGVRGEELARLGLCLFVSEKERAKDAGEILKRAPEDGTPLITMGRHERISRLFQEELGRRGLRWEPQIEVGNVEAVAAFAAQGFGVGMGVVIPGQAVHPGARVLPLKGFPELVTGALWVGTPGPLAAKFLDALRRRAAAARGRGGGGRGGRNAPKISLSLGPSAGKRRA